MCIKNFKTAALLFFLSIFFLPVELMADNLVQGHYCYTYGDNETLVEAKRLAHLYALRAAIERNKVYISSETKVENYTLIHDIVTNNANSYLANIKVKKLEVRNRTICYTIIATPKPITQIMKDETAREKIMKGFRKLLPNYGEMTDNELIDFAYNKWYSDILTKEDYLIRIYNKFVLETSDQKSNKK